jgi:hypothetical protein
MRYGPTRCGPCRTTNYVITSDVWSEKQVGSWLVLLLIMSWVLGIGSRVLHLACSVLGSWVLGIGALLLARLASLGPWAWVLATTLTLHPLHRVQATATMDDDSYYYEQASDIEYAAIDLHHQIQVANLRQVVSNLIGGIIIYEGGDTASEISELLLENHELKDQYRQLKNAERQYAHEEIFTLTLNLTLTHT